MNFAEIWPRTAKGVEATNPAGGMPSLGDEGGGTELNSDESMRLRSGGGRLMETLEPRKESNGLSARPLFTFYAQLEPSLASLASLAALTCSIGN